MTWGRKNRNNFFFSPQCIVSTVASGLFNGRLTYQFQCNETKILISFLSLALYKLPFLPSTDTENRNIITSVILFIAQMQSCGHRLEAEQLTYFLSKPCYAEIAVDNLP